LIDYDLLFGIVFVLLFTMIIGGTILLYPISRRLGALLEANTQEKKAAAAGRPKELEQVVARLTSLEQTVHAVAERQEFLDRLLLERQSKEQLRPGGSEPR
jgi:hypothetical protein